VVNRVAFRWIAAVYWLLAVGAAGADDPAFKLTLRDHRFEPAELVVPVVIFVGPLKPGRYPFFGDFNKDSAKGVLIAK
jgi:hypothetical protein